jgi:hypothetical protein
MGAISYQIGSNPTKAGWVRRPNPKRVAVRGGRRTCMQDTPLTLLFKVSFFYTDITER